MKSIKTILSILILFMAISFQAQNWNGKKIKGNGKVTTINKNIDNFNSLSIGGSFNVVLIKGNEPKISITGEENIIKLLETKISNQNLKINYKKGTNVYNTKKITITITFTKLLKVNLGGSGNISSKDIIKTNKFNLSLGGSGNMTLKINAMDISANIGGSGNINLEGITSSLNCSIAGSGNINAYDLIAEHVTASIAGSGNIKTTAYKKIKSKLVGSGNVYYKGNPKDINSKSIGSGSTIDKN